MLEDFKDLEYIDQRTGCSFEDAKLAMKGLGMGHASFWKSPISFCTRSIVKFTSRDPDRISWLSVSCTKDVPEDIEIA